jgi:putative redox protein
MTSTVHYLGSLRTEATHLASGDKIITDAPTDNHGKGEAFSPTDLFATSLASCALTIMGLAAQNHTINIDGASAEVTKIMSATPPRRVARIVVVFKMPAHNFTEKQRDILERAAHTCPVSLSLSSETAVDLTFLWA